MLTKARFQEAFLDIPEPDFKKWNVVMISGVQKIIMAKLQADAESPVTYSVCDTNLMNPQFWIKLESASLATHVTEEVQRRAKNFL